jgi:hypothetical protein
MGMDNLVEELSIKQAQEDHKGCIIVNFSLPYYSNDLKSRRHQFKVGMAMDVIYPRTRG